GRAAIERARALAAELSIQADLPACETEADEPSVRKWAEGWAALARRQSTTAERLASATKRRAKLSAEIAELEPAEERWRRAKEARESDARERGDLATQKKLLS